MMGKGQCQQYVDHWMNDVVIIDRTIYLCQEFLSLKNSSGSLILKVVFPSALARAFFFSAARRELSSTLHYYFI